MKKIVKLIINLLIIFIILELLLWIFKTNHKITYKIKENKETYQIQETYKKGTYHLKITNKNNIFTLEVPNTFHKRKKIIKKIYSYKTNDTTCIYPKLKKQTTNSNIICSKDKKTYSYEYYKKTLAPFTENLTKKGLTSPSWNQKSNQKTKLETIQAYQKNIPKNTYIYIYNYKGFYKITNKKIEKINLFKEDKYINHLGIQVDKYYIIPNYNEKYDYTKLYRINMKNGKIKTLKLKNKISKDSYINGVIDNEIYLFDKDELKQYKINPKTKQIKEVGNKKDRALYYNLKFQKIDVYTMRDKKLKFITIENKIKEIEKNTKIKYIEKAQNGNYYYQTENNEIYYYDQETNIKTLIAKIELSDFKVFKNTLYYINNDILYSYDFTNGINKLIKYKEFSFNPENRIAIYTK